MMTIKQHNNKDCDLPHEDLKPCFTAIEQEPVMVCHTRCNEEWGVSKGKTWGHNNKQTTNLLKLSNYYTKT